MKTKCLFLFLILNGILFAQNEGPTKITVFKPTDDRPLESAKKTNAQTTLHAIKWNYSLVLRGVFLLNYEYAFHEKLSLEVGAGLTYRDIIFEAFTLEDKRLNGSRIGFGLPKTRYAVELSGRFYPKEMDEFEGFYVAPVISYRTYSFSNSSGSVNTGSFKQGYDIVDLQFKLGYQYESFWSSDFVTDVYVGVGLRNAEVNYIDLNYPANGGPSYYTQGTQSISVAQGLIGVKLGVIF